MRNLLSISLVVIVLLLSLNKGYTQIEPDEQTATPVSLGSLNYAEYDKCKGLLYIAMPTSEDANNTRPIYKAYVYIKIGGQWRNMLTIRGEDANCCGTICSGGGSGTAWNSTWTPPYLGIVDFANHNNSCFVGPNQDNISGILESGHVKRRIGYYNGSVNNFSWFSYEDEGLCEQYNSNLDLVGNNFYAVQVPNPPLLNTGHSSGIGNNLTAICVYPTTGIAWALQFGIANVPRAAIVGNNIQIRVYVNYRDYASNWGNATAAHNYYRSYEYAVSTQAPDAPIALTATNNQCNQITLNWSNPSQTWSGQLNCTNTQVYNNVIFRNGVKVAVVPGNATSYIDNSPTLVPRQTYNYTVKTILWNEVGGNFRESSSSNVATGNMKMPPAQPSPFTASSNKCNSSIDLSWSQPNGTAVNQYNFSSPVFSTTLAASARSYTWTNSVVRGTTYVTKLVALNDCGYPSDTATVNGISPADPAIATGVNVSLNASFDTTTVTWIDNANNETKYQVVRQDNLGNVVLFDVNPNTTSFKDNGITSCRSYNYSVKAFNDCVQSGLTSATVSTPIIPPPNLNSTFTSTKKLVCSKGYFANRIEINWQNNNGQNIDLFKIYRKINGTTFDSSLVGTAGSGSGFYVDNTADARVYYKYTIVGVKFCNGTDILSNTSEDIGFRNPTGIVSGHIEYNGGIALMGAKVILQQSGGITGSSLQFGSGETLTIESSSTLGLTNQLRMEFWFKPTSYNASQNIVQKSGVFSFTHTGSNYIALINVGGTNYSITVPETNFPLNQWKHVSMQYNGSTTAFKLFGNGLLISSTTVPNGTISNVNNQIVFGGTNSTFLLDEYRLLALAAPLDTTIYIDHSRFLNASVSGSKIALHFDENFGNYAYDVSSQSNVFNANHFVKTSGVTWSLDRPSSGQLSYYGITDNLGNYTVSGITFSGTGENFTIIPSYLTHTFTPNSRSVFIGDASTVFNNQDFIDNSSFTVSGTLFYKNTTCPVPDGLLKIDGLPVIANGEQVKTDAAGNFSIQVPIGNHYVSVERFEHYMENGRFPITGTYNFQADIAGIAFIDSTRRSIVGRVVGGLVEAEKAPGMGRSKNNIGQVKIRIVSPVAGLPCYSAEVTTNVTTGEYRFDVPPLQYRIDSVYVLNNKFVLTSAITPSPFTNTNQLIDLRNALITTKVVDTLLDSSGGIVSIDSIRYHKRHDMIYRIKPTIIVTDTLNNIFIGEDSLRHGITKFSIKPVGPGWGPLGFPVFMQGEKYAAKIRANEIYNNFDNSAKDTVKLSGNILITNALVDGTDPNSSISFTNGVAIYRFTCGSPNTSTNALNPTLDYTKSIQINVVPTGASTVVWEPNPTVTPPIYHAFVLGQRIAGTGIATLGPEKVDFILRDPPGSGSSSSWSTGTSVSISEDYTRASSSETNISSTIKLGTEQSVGIGVETEVEVDNNVALGITTTGTNASGKGWTETMTSNYSVSTRDDADNVGAPADIFIGRSRNWLVGPTLNIELIDAAQCATVSGCFGPTVSGKRMVKKAGYAIAPGDVKTRFSYTQNEIETVVIPTLQSLRATKLAGPLYTSHIPSTHPNFGSNNDDPIWGASASTTTPDIYERPDTTGPSYTYRGNLLIDRDTVRIINTQISLWKKALARNEREKLECINNTGGILIDNFTLGSAIITNSYSTDREARSSQTWELSIGGGVNVQLGAVFGGVGAQFEESISINTSKGGEESKATTNSTSFEYTLTDGDPGDIMSIDVYKSPEGTGNIFVTRGGYTMCPYEDAVVSHYYNPTNPTAHIGSHTYNAAGYATIQLATVQREIPEISITPSNQFSIPSSQPAVYQLLLTNQSPLVVNNDIDFSIRVASVSNPFGAVVKIDGLSPNTTYNIPAGSSVVKTLTVERGPIEINYDSLMIIFSSACSEDIADTAYISAHFIPTCTDISLTSPSNNWVFNRSIRDTANVIASNYNYNYGAAIDTSTTPDTYLGFNKISLEFKPNSTSTWTQFQTFYKYPLVGQDPIPTNQIFTQHLWDISNFPDGGYELKAVAHCLNKDGSFSIVESPVLSGVMDRINPHPFGTPSPADGILDPNDDISIQFNEPIDIGAISSLNFDVRGVLNGGNIRHYESLQFDGINDYVEVAAGASLQKRSFTFEFWAKLNATGINQTIISQGTDALQSMAIGVDATNRLRFNFASQTSTSIAPIGTPTQWHHYAISYDYALQAVSMYVDGTIVNSGSTGINFDYNGSGKIAFGRLLPSNTNYFNGNLHDVRLWSSNRTNGDIILTMNKDLNRSSSGLLYNWKMDEAEGIIAKDNIRSRNADIYGASWSISPTGNAVSFDGVNDRIDIASSTIPINKEMDFTLEFWFKSNQAGVATLFSNGRGDGLGADSLYSWNIQKDASGIIHVYHKGFDFIATTTDYFDNNWHHFALVMQRSSNMTSYIDGNLQNSVQALSYQQMGGPFMYLGARGYYTGSVPTYDRFYAGQIDEFRFWNTARKFEQVNRDKRNRLLGNEYALQAYLPFESYTVVLGVPVLNPSFLNRSANTLAVTPQNGVSLISQTPTIKIPRPIQAVAFTYSVNNDKIIITPTTSPELIENVTLDITVKDIYDLQGNKMQSPKTWIAFINKNQVLWITDELSFTKKPDSVRVFTTQIINTGGATKQYTIGGLPNWITTSFTSGVIAPNSAQNITFTIPAGTNIGSYSADLTLTTDFGYNEVLRINLNVIGEAPNWTFDRTKFQYSMNIFGQMRIDGVIATNTSNQIAAFINDTLCGNARLQYLPAYDRYQVFLTVYSNKITGDSIKFYFYDATTGLVFVNVSPRIMFVESDVVGTINSPVTFVANSEVKLNIPLNAGWTWVSLPLQSTMLQHSNMLMANLTNTNGDVVRSISAYDQYDTNWNWLGNISSSPQRYQNSQSYKIRRASTGILSLVGARIHPDSARAAINVVPGWNWIGFVSTKNADVNTAMANYNAVTGDILKSQFEFAYYDNLIGWVGSLTSMKPGEGYMLKSTASSTFHYPLSVFFGGITRMGSTSTKVPVSFNFEPAAFEKTMSVVAKTGLCNQLASDENIVLGAFDEKNNLRGYAGASYVQSSDSYHYYLTVFSNHDNEKFQLKYIDVNSGVTIPAQRNIQFVSDTLIGTPTNPLSVTVASDKQCRISNEDISGSEDSYSGVTVYPNPFANTIQVSFNKSVDAHIELLDVVGKVVFSTSVKDSRSLVLDLSNTSIVNGVYTMKVSGGKNMNLKVIKTSY